MKFDFSIKVKFITLLSASFILFFILMSFMHYRNLTQSRKEIGEGFKRGNMLVLRTFITFRTLSL